MSQDGPKLLPPPPPPAGLPMQPVLSEETNALIATLRIEVAQLQSEAQDGNDDAKSALVNLYNAHYANWATHCRNHVRPITDAITEQENQKRLINSELTSNLEQLRVKHEKLENEARSYQEQKLDLAEIDGAQELIHEIDYLLEVALVEEAQQLNQQAQYRREELQIALTTADANIARLRADKREPDNIAFQLKKIHESLPKPKGRFQAAQQGDNGAQANRAQPRAMDIEDWILGRKQDPADHNSERNKAILGGIFIRNLTRFLMTDEDARDQKEYSLEELVRKYNGFTNPQLQGLNERIIIAIAVGYIRRSEEAPYCQSHIRLLKDTVIDATKERVLSAYLARFYAAFPEIEQASDILLHGPEEGLNLAGGLQAIQRDIQQTVHRANHKGHEPKEPRALMVAPVPRPALPRLAPVNPLKACVDIAPPIPALIPAPKRDLAYFDQKQQDIEQIARAGQKAQAHIPLQPELAELRAGFDEEIQEAIQIQISSHQSSFKSYQTQTHSILNDMEQLREQLQTQIEQLESQKRKKRAEKARAKELAQIAKTERRAARHARKEQRRAQEREQGTNQALIEANLQIQQAQHQLQTQRQLQAQIAIPAPVVNLVALLGEQNIPAYINAFLQQKNRMPKFDETIKLCPLGLAGDRAFKAKLIQNGISK